MCFCITIFFKYIFKALHIYSNFKENAVHYNYSGLDFNYVV